MDVVAIVRRFVMEESMKLIKNNRSGFSYDGDGYGSVVIKTIVIKELRCNL